VTESKENPRFKYQSNFNYVTESLCQMLMCIYVDNIKLRNNTPSSNLLDLAVNVVRSRFCKK